MLCPAVSRVSCVGAKRYKYSSDILNIYDELPPIDAVFISHDHYDRLYCQSVVKLNNKVSQFFVPKRVSSYLNIIK